MNKYTYLSHVLSKDTPSYGNFDPVKITRSRQICCGDTSNNSKIEISCHIGTHVDASSHFCQEGKSLDQISPDYWLNKSAYLLILKNVSEGQIIGVKEIEPHLDQFNKGIDFLILKTGFERFRSDDHENSPYIFKGPGISPDLANYLLLSRLDLEDLKNSDELLFPRVDQ